MSRVFLTMAMSLDRFITGPDDDAENPAGTDGMRLMNWLGGGAEPGAEGPQSFRPRLPNSQLVFDEAMATGAVITGKRTGDFAGYWVGITTTACRSSCRRIGPRRRTRTSWCTTSRMASPPVCNRPSGLRVTGT